MSQVTFERELLERALFEAHIAKDCGDLSTFGSGPNMHYCNSGVNHEWIGWKTRAALLSAQALPVGELTHLKGVDAGPLSEWIDLVKRGYVSKDELLIMERDAVRVAAARTQPVREPLTNERLHAIWSSLGGFAVNHSFAKIARAIEAAHGITKKGEQ